MPEVPEFEEQQPARPVTLPASQVIHPKLAAPLFKLIKLHMKNRHLIRRPPKIRKRKRQRIYRP